jgi:hypothetical protein
MTAADVAYVVAWEAQTGIKLNLAFNGVGACTAPSVAAESSANCTGSVTDSGTTYTDPGQVVDTTVPAIPDDSGLVNALLADKADFNWITHTWSHEFLGCVVWQPQAVNSVTANATDGSFTAGAYNYEVTAATAYGESEPSLPQSVTVGAGGSATLSWPDATNGVGTNGTAGPTLAAEEANHTGGSGFWGYNVYRENPGTTTYGLVGQVAEDPSGATATYSFTDTGATAPAAAPGSSDTFPTATNPGIDCSSAAGSWDPASDPSGTTDASIQTEIAWDQAFAAANGLPNYTSAAVVTGEHSGVENPNMPAALAATGITTFATDASRQPNQYSLTSGSSTATSAPRYPSNIYYNASNWTDELNEYNTLYVAPGVSLGNATYPTETGHCDASSATTCLSTPATESSLLASESRIMLSHVLANNPRVGYAHQTNLIGGSDPANGYTLLTLLNNMLTQYDAWTSTAAPLVQMTDTTEAQVLGQQSAWAAAETAGSVKASETNGVVTVTNASGSPVSVPVTTPQGTTVGGAAFGQSYGGELSTWTTIAAGASLTLTEHVAPTIISANSASSIVGTAFSATVYTTGEPAPAITETGALPAGMTFVDNGNGTATLAGTAAKGSGGLYPITITAANGVTPNATQAFTLTNSEAPTITSAATASFYTGVAGTYTVTTTGYPAATITETGTLPAGLTFAAPTPATGSATIAGTPAAGSVGNYPVTISATNSSGSMATLNLAITVASSAAPVITSGATAYFTLNEPGSFAVTTTGAPPASITETGALPAGLTFTDNGNGTALLAGTPTVSATTNLTITADNKITPSATQTLSIIVGNSPHITSAASTTFVVGDRGSFTVTSTGFPAPSLGWSGTLPDGITFVDNGNGTATLSGTPAAGTAGKSYPLTLLTANGTGTASQSFILIIDQAPAITSANSVSLTVGKAFTFTVTTSGYPTPSLGDPAALPAGVTFVANGNGTATIAGTPAVGTAGSYPITLTASNGTSPDANQSFTLTVLGVPALAGGDRLAATPDGNGYWIVGPTGSLATYGTAANYGSMAGHQLNSPIVGVASTPDGQGYWMVASDGGVFSFGDAQFHGSMGGRPLNRPIVGIAGTPDGQGYWMVASDGGVFSFGDAQFHGSMGGKPLNQPIVDLTSDGSGQGYWMVASDGGIFTFGDAQFYGSTGGIHLNKPVIGLTATRDSQGYWMVASDGGVFTFGDAQFHGSGAASGRTAVGLIASPSSSGYAVIDTDGTRAAFGW